MSDHLERLEKLLKESPGILREGLTAAEDADVRATMAELKQLRERIGEPEIEWYVRWPVAGGRYEYERCMDEQDARETAPDDGICEVGSRLVGEFKVADDA